MLDWEHVFKHSPVPQFLVDREHKIVARSDSTASDCLGNASANLADLIPASFGSEVENWARAVLESDSKEFATIAFSWDADGATSCRLHAKPLETAGNRFLLITVEKLNETGVSPDLRMEAIGLVSRYVVHETNNACGGALLAAENGLALLHEIDSADLIRESLLQIGEAMQSCGRMSHELLAFGRDDHSWTSDWSLHDLGRRAVMLATKLSPSGCASPSLELLTEDKTTHLNGLEVIFSIGQILLTLMAACESTISPVLSQFQNAGAYGFTLRVNGCNAPSPATERVSTRFLELSGTLLRKNGLFEVASMAGADNRYSRIIFSGGG
ncbi:MAG: hypothetical protein ACE37I_10725 [Rubinisphaera brasiliensis]|uniref:hypothetical protein n=1 Tax=Rubinisphaera brasiliensis TaxID=119 RepID=UPI0039195464